MKVPMLSDSQDPSYQTPMRSVEKVQTPNVPNAVPGAFGEDVAKSIEKIGNTGVDMSSAALAHMQQMNYWDEQEKGYAALENFRTTHSNLLNDPTPTDIQQGDTTITKPAGYLQRNLEQSTKGDPVEYQKKATELANSYLDSIQNPLVKRMMARRMYGEIGGGVNQIIKHVANQDRLTYVKGAAASIANYQNMAAGATDDKSLGEILDHITDDNNNMSHRLGDTEDMRQVSEDKALEPAVLNAIKGSIQSTGATTGAQMLLDGVKDRLSPKSYDDISSKIDSEKIRWDNQQKRQVITQKISYRAQTISGVLSAQANLNDPDGLVASIYKKDPQLAQVLNTVLKKQQSGGQYRGTDKDFANMVNKIWPNATQEDVSDSIVKTMQEHPNMSNDHLAIMFNAALNKAKTLPLTNDNVGDGKIDPQQQSIDTHVAAIQKWGKNQPDGGGNALINFFRNLAGSKNPQDAHDNAIKSSNQANNPDSINYKAKDVVKLSDGSLFEVTGHTADGKVKGRVLSARPSNPGQAGNK